MTLHFKNKNTFMIGATLAVFLFGSVALADIVSGLSTTAVSNDITLTQLTLSEPSNTTVGDFLLANISVDGGSPAIITPPMGWVLIARVDNDTNVSIASYYKVNSASDSSSFTWNISPQTHAAGGITRYSGIDTNNPIDVFATSTGRGTIATAPSVTTTTSNERVVALFATNVGSSGSPLFSTSTNMTKKYDVKNTPFGPTTAAEDATQISAGATGSKSVTISQGPQRDWVAQTIALKPTIETADNFNSYSDGTIVGSSGGSGWTSSWSGDTRYQVEGTVTYEGAKALSVSVSPTDSPVITRNFTPRTSGILHWAQRKDLPDQGSAVALYSGNTMATVVSIGSSNQPSPNGPVWFLQDGNTPYVIQQYTVGNFDVVDMQFDTNTEMYRVSINGGPYTDWKNFMNSVSSVDNLQIYLSGSGNDVGPSYWDDIKLSN